MVFFSQVYYTYRKLLSGKDVSMLYELFSATYVTARLGRNAEHSLH